MRKLTKAEAGKLGALATKRITDKRLVEKKQEYLAAPNKCKECAKELPYSKRNNKFCGNSCSAKFGNARRERKSWRKTPKTWNCLNCGKEHEAKKYRVGKYCDNKCQSEYQSKQRVDKWLNEGVSWGASRVPQWVKRYLLDLQNEKCSVCGIDSWMGEEITLECDHVDGNHLNNDRENLRMICPNCHSQTDTYKAKNMGNGRTYRRAS